MNSNCDVDCDIHLDTDDTKDARSESSGAFSCFLFHTYIFLLVDWVKKKKVCSPKCINGGMCGKNNRCVCQQGWKGAWCQNGNTKYGLFNLFPK